jgi:ribulose-5-phosphate 4-epimerase/fuculose-1-phosphate aldolase
MLDKPATTTITQDRIDLAAALRLAAHFDFHEGICNHFSVQCAGDDERYLINSYGVHWSEMTPDALLLIDGEGNVLEGDGVVEASARNIHIASHRANPRHKAILHTHMPYATALTMLEDGRLVNAHQTACRYHGRTGYDDEYGGLAVTEDEGERIASATKDNQHIDIMFLANHGVVVSASSVAMAFDDLYYLERACRQQVLAMSTGKKLRIIPDDVVAETFVQIRRDSEHFAEVHFTALKRVIGIGEALIPFTLR